MSFRLQVVDTRTGLAVEIPFSESGWEVLTLQMTSCVEYGGLDRFAQWLGVAVESALPEVVDYDLKSPSEAQVSFALAIARALGLTLKPDVLRYRGAMHEFLSAHKEAFEKRRKRGTPPATECPD